MRSSKSIEKREGKWHFMSVCLKANVSSNVFLFCSLNNVFHAFYLWFLRLSEMGNCFSSLVSCGSEIFGD